VPIGFGRISLNIDFWILLENGAIGTGIGTKPARSSGIIQSA
jgi:hypothetical protein